MMTKSSVVAMVAVILVSMQVPVGCAKKQILEKHGSAYRPKDISNEVATFAPGWTVVDCGDDMEPGLREEWGGRKNVLVTHPMSCLAPCVLTKEVDVPAGKTTTLDLRVSHDPAPPADWLLVVKVDDKEVFQKMISKKVCKDGWATVNVDLSTYAGKSIKLAMEHQANNWAWESAFWSEIAINSK